MTCTPLQRLLLERMGENSIHNPDIQSLRKYEKMLKPFLSVVKATVTSAVRVEAVASIRSMLQYFLTALSTQYGVDQSLIFNTDSMAFVVVPGQEDDKDRMDGHWLFETAKTVDESGEVKDGVTGISGHPTSPEIIMATQQYTPPNITSTNDLSRSPSPILRINSKSATCISPSSSPHHETESADGANEKSITELILLHAHNSDWAGKVKSRQFGKVLSTL